MFQLLVILLISSHLATINTQTLECTFCQTAAEFLLKEPEAVGDIQVLLDMFCNILPPSLQVPCTNGVKALAVLLEALPSFLSRNEQFTGYALCTMVNMCVIDCCVSDAPEQVHISYLDDPHTTVGITWVTRQQTSSEVKYGTAPGNLTSVATGLVKTYTPGYWHGWIHNVPLTNLLPGTTYFYQVGSDASGWSTNFHFTTEPSDSSQHPFRLLNIGDMGNANSTNNMKHITALVEANAVDFIIHNGDISYADGFQARWDVFFRSFESAVANMPYMVTLGNHEIGIIGALNLTIGYVHRFMLPGSHSLSLDYENLFYSWNYGSVHFISIDTESVLDVAGMTQKQVTWIEQDLQAVDRTRYPWVVVYGHRPFYCSNTGPDCNEMAVLLRNALEDVLYKYQVNLVLEAHRHNYERMWPTYKETPTFSYNEPQAPVYILNGAGGNREGLTTADVLQSYSAKFVSKWGYGLITVHNQTVLDYDFYDADTGEVLDHVSIIRAQK
jgi:hypothetical protein